MPYDGEEDYWGDEPEQWEPLSETITHLHPTLPFIKISQTRYVGAEPGDEPFEDWGFMIYGPDRTVAYDSVAYSRGESSEAEMLAFVGSQAEKHLIDDRGPFFVFRMYLESGEFREKLDAVMRKHGQWPLWRRAEAAVTWRFGLHRHAIHWREQLGLTLG